MTLVVFQKYNFCAFHQPNIIIIIHYQQHKNVFPTMQTMLNCASATYNIPCESVISRWLFSTNFVIQVFSLNAHIMFYNIDEIFS